MERAELLQLAWSAGNLAYQVKDFQQPIYDACWKAIDDPTALKHCLSVSRRFGKTHVVSIIAIEYAIRYPGAQINFASGTDKAMKKILRGIFPVILAECPSDLKPKLTNGVLQFPNGSCIYTAGVNNQHADDLRGTSSHLSIVDEAGMIDELEYLVRSVLMPQQLTVNGTMLLLSTPPPTVDHDYTKIYHECLEENQVTTFTVYDNTEVMADSVKFQAYVKEAGGIDSTTFLREYNCNFVTDTNKLIIPEWLKVKEACTVSVKRNRLYRYWLKYVGMDLGFRHNTALLFCHFDFHRQKFVVEREVQMKGAEVTSKSIADCVKSIEAELWPDANSQSTRISDNNNPILLNDIQSVHGINFSGTSKDDLDAMVSQTRLLIGAGKLEIDPSCTDLLGCLEFGVWDKHRKGFAESRKYGHYDSLAALIYVLRYFDAAYNPVPVNLDIANIDLLMPVQQYQDNPSVAGLKQWQRTANKPLNTLRTKKQGL